MACMSATSAFAHDPRFGDAQYGITVGRTPAEGDRIIVQCLLAAAAVHHVAPAILFTLLRVEGGRLGQVSRNTNATVDIGPMQINEIHIPEIAARWHTDAMTAFVAVRDNFCANVEAGAWILEKAIQDAGGDFWDGVGRYHSATPAYKLDYLRKVLAQVLRLPLPRAPAQPRWSGMTQTAER